MTPNPDLVYNQVRWKAARRESLSRHGYRCARCKRATVLEVHHKIPLAVGGKAYDQENLQPLCKACHFAEHHPDAPRVGPGRKAWRQYLGVYSQN